MKAYKFILAILVVVCLGSCGKDTGMRITTNTFANEKIIPQGFPENSSFTIATKQKGDSLFTREVSQKIATILKNKGFTIKPSNADYNLNFSFGMKKSTHVRDVPVFIPDYGHWYYHHYHYPYGYGYGYTIAYIPEEYTLYNKILLIEVHKSAGWLTKKTVPVWQGVSDFYEEDSDLRNDIDYLLVTVFKHFGKNTKRYIKARVEQDDERVKKLRQDYFRPIGHN